MPGSQPLSDEGNKVVDDFLASTDETRLFVWTSSSKTHAGLVLPATSVASAIVFCRFGESTLQCLTLPSASSGEESTTTTTTSILQALQIYTQQCFMPTVQSLLQQDDEALYRLQDKLRALDVALQQTSRSAHLPSIELQIHPVIQGAVEKRGEGSTWDWEALGLLEKLNDDDFLNELQALVSSWIAQIRTVTTLKSELVIQASSDQAPNPDAVAHEMAYWTALQQELQHIQEQLQSPGVEGTVGLLREAKRFVATLALENNTGLEQAVTYAADMSHFLKGYPLADLQAAADWEQMAAVVQAIFDHLNKIRSSRYYSLQRGISLLEGTTVVLRDAIQHLLLQDKHKNFLFMDYSEYQRKIRYPVLDVFVQFEDRWQEWKEFMLDQGRRRKVTGLSKLLDKMVLHHLPLRERLDQIDEFRQAQETLRNVVHTVLREDEPAALQQVEHTPRQIFGSLAVLDLSPGGKQALETALEEYDLQMDAMEERLARLLREKLQACQVSINSFVLFGTIAYFN